MFLFVFGFRSRSSRSSSRFRDHLTNVLGGVGSTSTLFFCLVGLLAAVDGRSGVHLCRKGNMRNKMGNMYPRPQSRFNFFRPAGTPDYPLARLN